MKVLLATGIYPPDIGGPATYSKLLFDELPKHGIEVQVLSFGEVRWLPKVIRHVAFFFKILVRGRKVDVIFAQDPVSVGLPAFLAARWLRKRFFLKIVGDYAWEQGTQRFGVNESLDTFSENQTGYPFFVTLFKRIETYVARHAETIIVPSQYLKRIVMNWGIPEGRISVVYNAFDTAVLSDIEKPTHLSEKKGPTIISIGRLVAWKGFDMVINCMPELVTHYPTLMLTIVGDGPDMQKLQKVVSDLNLENHVTLSGRLSRTELLSKLQQSDVFVLNTLYEGFSHQLLEALALGTPVITTDIGGNPEIIEHQKNGLLIPYNDKAELLKSIRMVLDNPSVVRMFAQEGKNKVSGFTTERMLNGVMQQMR